MAAKKYNKDSNNLRFHSEENKSLVKKSLSELGTGRSIVVDSENNIVAGNQTYESAMELGIKIKEIETDGTELVVIKRTDLKTEDKKRKELAIADNSTTDTSNFIEEKIKDDHFEEIDFPKWGVRESDEQEQVDYSKKNKEINVDDLGDEMKLTLNFESTIYWEVKKKLSEIGMTPEDAICKLLGIEIEAPF